MAQDDTLYKELEKVAKIEGLEIFKISSITKQGLKELLVRVEELLKEIPKENLIELNQRKVYKLNEDKNEFQIVREEDMYVVIGPTVEKLISRVNLEDTESMYYFQRKLDELGVNEALKEAGVKEGDTVKVVDWELEWYD